MIKLEIGTVVDFIDSNVRWRGLIVSRTATQASIAVLGVNGLLMQPLSRLIGVTPMKEVLKVFKDK